MSRSYKQPRRNPKPKHKVQKKKDKRVLIEMPEPFSFEDQEVDDWFEEDDDYSIENWDGKFWTGEPEPNLETPDWYWWGDPWDWGDD